MTTHTCQRRRGPFHVGVCIRLPSPLVAAVDQYADDQFCRRSGAIRVLLEAGLEALGKPQDGEPSR